MNGAVFKADGNFLNPFFFVAIDETWITLGSYPLHEIDLQRVKQTNGVTAVLNIMDATDHRQHGISVDQYRQMSRQAGIIEFENSPVSDYDIDIYVKTVFEAACSLHNLIVEGGHRVFVHCAAGVSRSNTLFLLYLALFGDDDDNELFGLDNCYNRELPAYVDELAAYLDERYPHSSPNKEVVIRAITEYRDYVRDHQHKTAAERERARKAAEEAKRRREKEAEDARRRREQAELEE